MARAASPPGLMAGAGCSSPKSFRSKFLLLIDKVRILRTYIATARTKCETSGGPEVGAARRARQLAHRALQFPPGGGGIEVAHLLAQQRMPRGFRFCALSVN